MTVTNLYVGEGSDFSGVPTRMITVNGSFTMSIYNPARLFGMHISSSSTNLIFSEIRIATGSLKKYYQPR
ncbi:hypothetical protein, partial [Streptomyces fildesensis]|uniref:hypothetical protein n=1 Tax=Streptomyces fildesensis TaxID=375757 RepID=UPI001E44A07E